MAGKGKGRSRDSQQKNVALWNNFNRQTACACTQNGFLWYHMIVCLAELNGCFTCRRLDTESSKHVPLLQSLALAVLVSISTFFCQQCFQDTERIVQVEIFSRNFTFVCTQPSNAIAYFNSIHQLPAVIGSARFLGECNIFSIESHQTFLPSFSPCHAWPPTPCKPSLGRSGPRD